GAAELELRSAIGHEPDTGGVTLASLHAAKGQEWDAVFLPCLTDGAVPIVYAQTAEAIEEERRLLYVGITRARDRLFLSWALARAPGGHRTRKPSRFLDGLRGPIGDGLRTAGTGKRRSLPRSFKPALPSLTSTVPQGDSLRVADRENEGGARR